MKLNYVKVNPVENMTIFVMDQVDSSQHMIMANKLMDYNCIHGEQVGFVENPRTMKGKSLNTLRLQMMGGEFCGNATRSLAALMVHLKVDSITKNDDIYNVILEVSGYDELLSCQVRETDEESVFYSKVKMPLPHRISKTNISFEGTLIDLNRIDFPGITHFIVDENEVNEKEKFFEVIKDKMEKEDYDAFGLMFYNYEDRFLKPLVYVRATDSKYWERSCASGTSALGVALALNKNISIEEKVKQPGGELEVSITLENGKITELYLDGKVDIVSEGVVYLEGQL
ncbi:diaminopimelate epimerase [Tissierella sp. Yu-01]|uniref:diaminopimelate epimerase n=1 Tax=Tissierella sp. Yu-01 TaxID=3035694 RepID=UPI00240E7C4B|nr:diaminopimelate epimerase [Tissierella sp. Yu-01]WFA10219.1 diaminopimelate epimerase [Tissierella sp. Yu-01]